MAKFETYTYYYQGKDYIVADIPNVFAPVDNRRIKIGPRSLSMVLYSDETGYVDDEAKAIDEEIYAYIDDVLFNQDIEDFLSVIKLQLD